MEYSFYVVHYLHILSKTMKEQPTLILSMEFWHFRWVSLENNEKQCRLAYCNESRNWIQTFSDSNAETSFTLRLLLQDDVTMFKCAWRSKRWYSEGLERCRSTALCCEAFHIWTEQEEAQNSAIHQTIQIAMLWTFRTLFELKLANRIPFVHLPN